MLFGVSFCRQIHSSYVLNIQLETDKSYRKKISKWSKGRKVLFTDYFLGQRL